MGKEIGTEEGARGSSFQEEEESKAEKTKGKEGDDEGRGPAPRRALHDAHDERAYDEG